MLTTAGIRISMDGRGRWMDDGHDAKAGIAEWIGFYNNRRPHQALGNRTPMAVWRDGVTGTLAKWLWT